jgi:hypothetical protein
MTHKHLNRLSHTILVGLLCVLGVALLSLGGCGGQSGEIAKGLLLRDLVHVSVYIGVVVAVVVIGVACILIQEAIDGRRLRKSLEAKSKAAADTPEGP